MEGLDLSAHTDKQPRADPGVEVAPTVPISKSSSAQQPTEESTTVGGGLGDGERLAPEGRVVDNTRSNDGYCRTLGN